MGERVVDAAIGAAMGCIVGILFGVWLSMTFPATDPCRASAKRLGSGDAHICYEGAAPEIVGDVVVCRCPSAGVEDAP